MPASIPVVEEIRPFVLVHVFHFVGVDRTRIKLLEAVVVAVKEIRIDRTTRQKTLRPVTAFGGNKLRAQQDRLRHMRGDVIYVRIREPAWYHLKSTKLYGRKVVDMDENGDFIIGDWELITTRADSKAFTISGDYVCFAYSGDITWGTDFPFSRVFWNEPHRDVEEVVITWGGGCRNADISINVTYSNAWGTWAGAGNTGLNEYIEETNCSSHKEWKP